MGAIKVVPHIQRAFLQSEVTPVQVALLRMNIYVCVGVLSKIFLECLSECCSFFRNGLYSCTLKFFIMLFLMLRNWGAKDGG